MHPMFAWWNAHRSAHFGGRGCGPGHMGGHGGPFGGGGHFGGHGGGGGEGGDDFGGGAFGVRRPLRFLAWKLELEESQVAELAKILSDLKTERAQAAVDQRRSVATLADVVGGETFDESKAREAAEIRLKSAERLRDAVVTALGRMHGVLDKDQRERLAYLLRTGQLVI